MAQKPPRVGEALTACLPLGPGSRPLACSSAETPPWDAFLQPRRLPGGALHAADSAASSNKLQRRRKLSGGAGGAGRGWRLRLEPREAK